MSRRRIGRWIAVLLASAVALVAPVPTLTPTAEAADPRSPLQNTVTSYVNQTITWGGCGVVDGLELDSRCAKVRVPMDWQSPGKGTIQLAIAYLPATGVSKGLLTSNPGGPGEAGRAWTEALSLSKSQLRQYDLLGFDPRGFGASSKVQCLTTQAKLNKLPKVADRRVRNKATHAVEVAEAKLFGEACASQSLARYINTQQTVWDLDFLRQLLARDKQKSFPVLNYIGYSYGTWLGTWYADAYPTNVGRFILDSNMAWTASMYYNQTLDSMSFQRRRDKMYFPYLARHHADFGLGKSAASVKKKYESTRKKLAAIAKKDVKKGKTPAFGPEDLDYITALQLYTNEEMTNSGFVLDAIADYASKPSAKNKRTMTKRVQSKMSKAPFVVQRSSKSVRGSALRDISDGLAGTIVRCNDSANGGNLKQLLKRADADAKKYPFTGYLNTIPMCAYWKFKPQTRTIDLAGVSAKLLMIQSEGDPATAYEGALAAHRKTAGKTTLVSVDNEGQHGLYVDGPSPCVEALGDRFLFTSWRPVNSSARCTTTPLPFDSRVYTLSGPVSGTTSTAKKAIKAKNKTVKAVRADVAKRVLS